MRAQEEKFLAESSRKENELKELQKVLAQISKGSEEYFIFSKDLTQLKTEISMIKEKVYLNAEDRGNGVDTSKKLTTYSDDQPSPSLKRTILRESSRVG